MELAKVINTGKTPLVLKHDKQGNVTIQPGKERVVTLDHVTVAFGNPGARNEGKNKVRDADFAALQTRWGFYSGIFPDAAWEGVAIHPETGEELGPMCPQFEVHDLDDERIWTILDDPKGERAGGTYNTNQDVSDSNILSKRVEQLERQLQQAIDLMGRQQSGPIVPVPGDSSDSSTTSSDSTAPASAASKPDPDDTTQAERNEKRDDIPKATAKVVKKDGPSTTRVGSK